MNDYKTTHQNNILPNLFAIICIIIVCYIGVVSSKFNTSAIYPGEQISNQSGSNQTKSGTSGIIQERGQTKQDATRRDQIPTRNSSVQNRTGGKPMGSLQTVPAVKTGIVTRVFVKDWKLTYTKVEAVVNNTSTTKHILYECTYSRNQPHCINSVLGVSKGESSIFKNCYENSCLGIKPNGKIKTYGSINEGISDRVNRYNKYWYANDNAKERIEKSNYCNGDCEKVGSNWRLSYDSFIGYIE